MTALLDWNQPEIWAQWIASEIRDDLAQACIVARTRRRFGALRSFHAARPTSTDPYYRDGIKPLSRTAWQDLVEDYFLSRTDEPDLAAAILQARDVQFQLVSDGRVHFCCDQRLLEERDGYTLIYGSLSLLAVAIRIDKQFGTSFKADLRQRGQPAIFVCDIPMSTIEDDVLAELVTSLADAQRTMIERDVPLSPFGFHFSIAGPLSPKAVVAHCAPRRVIDAVYSFHLGEPELLNSVLRGRSRRAS